MSEPEKQDHWKALANLMGIAVPEPGPSVPSPASGTPASPAPAPATQGPTTPSQQRKTRPSPPKRKDHWGLVAGELGLAPPPITEQKAEPEARERPARPAHEKPSRSWAAAIPSGTEKSERSAPPVEEETDPLAVAPEPFMEEVAGLIDEVEEVESPLVEVEDVAESRRRPRSEQEEGEDRGRRRRRRRRKPSRHGDTESARDASLEESAQEDFDEDAIVDEEESDEDREEELAERPRPPHRRHPRGSESPSEAAESRRRPSWEDKVDEDDEDDEEEDDTEDSSREMRPKHKKIPSWNEAMELIVQANLANRDRDRDRGGRRGRRP
jgi:ribonuclease E